MIILSLIKSNLVTSFMLNDIKKTKKDKNIKDNLNYDKIHETLDIRDKLVKENFLWNNKF